MKVDMVMPQMGESIAEATISKWLKKPGDSVKKDEIILEISTDKVDSEIPSPASGTLVEVLYQAGDVVPVKTKIAVIDSAAGASAEAAPRKADAPPAAQKAAPPKAEPQLQRVNGGPKEDTENGGRFLSPLVKSLAAQHGVPLSELNAIQGSGQGGRVNKDDFYRYLEGRKVAGGATPLRAEAPAETRPQAKPAPSMQRGGAEVRQFPPLANEGSPALKAPPADQIVTDWAPDGTKVVVMDSMRQAIAEHMVRSKHTSPHVYSVQEVDMTAVSKWRSAHKDKFTKNEGFNLSFTPFFLEAAVHALQKYPYVNSSVDGKKVILKKNINLGCAVALGNAGLIVPVIKRAEEKNFVGLVRALNDLALRARNKKLLPDDVTGGTFTVTNPGVFGTIIGNPIINQPQVAILCLGAIKKRPVVVEDMIAIREICYLTLSYDHRVIDGALGGQYLAAVREYLEGWDKNRTLY